MGGLSCDKCTLIFHSLRLILVSGAIRFDLLNVIQMTV